MEEELRQAQEDVQRLRRERNAWRDYYEQGQGEEAADDGEGEQDNPESPSSSKPRISRKESEKISLPPFPKITALDAWKAQAVAAVVAASADPDQTTWIL